MKALLFRVYVWTLWFLFGGCLSFVFWLALGVFFLVTVIGFRRGVACFRIARYALDPFNKSLVFATNRETPGSEPWFLWQLVLGIAPFLFHLLCGIGWFFTFFGVPIADKFFELASVCFNPRRVVAVRRNSYAAEDLDDETVSKFEEWKRNFKGRIFALPYMSCRATSFKRVWRTLGDFKGMEIRDKMFTHTYEQAAKELVEKYDIRDGDIVIGTCLGAMVAQEMVKFRKLKAMVLVAAPRSNRDYYRLYNYLGPIVIALSDFLLAFLLKASPAIPPRIAAIMDDADGGKNLRKFIRQALAWKGCRLDLPVCRIHGDVDFLFPIPVGCDYLVRGGHFIGIVSSDACVASIKRFLVERIDPGEATS